eukprot:3795653-Pyramimonas_sp.AAC.1
MRPSGAPTSTRASTRAGSGAQLPDAPVLKRNTCHAQIVRVNTVRADSRCWPTSWRLCRAE